MSMAEPLKPNVEDPARDADAGDGVTDDRDRAADAASVADDTLVVPADDPPFRTPVAGESLDPEDLAEDD